LQDSGGSAGAVYQNIEYVVGEKSNTDCNTCVHESDGIYALEDVIFSKTMIMRRRRLMSSNEAHTNTQNTPSMEG